MTEESDDQEQLGNKRLTLGRRLALVERDVRSHARSLSELVRIQHEHATEVGDLARWKLEKLLEEAREDERAKALNDRLTRIENSIKDLTGGITKALWIGAVPLIGAMVLGLALVVVFGTKLIPSGV